MLYRTKKYKEPQSDVVIKAPSPAVLTWCRGDQQALRIQEELQDHRTAKPSLTGTK